MTAQPIYLPIKPTVLVVRKHNKTGKHYFHKTWRLDKIDSYLGSGPKWVNHCDKHGWDVSTLWVSNTFYDESIQDFALKFSEDHDITNSDLWANQIPETGLGGGQDTSKFIDYKSLSEKRNRTINDPLWKNTIGKQRSQKQSKSVKQTINDPLWKNTIGKEQIKKIKSYYEDSEWMVTTKAQAIQKTKAYYEDSEWISTIKLESNKKVSEKATIRQLDPVWREKMYRTCEHCGKRMDPGNFSRYHGNKCKSLL